MVEKLKQSELCFVPHPYQGQVIEQRTSVLSHKNEY